MAFTKIDLQSVYDENGLVNLDKYSFNTLDNITLNNDSPNKINNSRVTVITPVGSCRNYISTVARSIESQTYDIEWQLVFDGNQRDASSYFANSHQLFICQGAYGARNHGLKHAAGDFITVHDADDWSHPQKLEMQVKALLDNPTAVACVSHWARCTTNMTFETRPDGSVVHRNVSSLMIRREVFERLGYWDRVSVNADTEYYYRILAAYGIDSIIEVLPGVPLALGRRHEASLTMQPETHWQTQFGGVRKDYMDAAFEWHKECQKTGNWYLPFAPKKRPFPVPELINRSVIELGDRVWPHIKGYRASNLFYKGCILLCGHAASDNLFGAERSLLDVAKAISDLGYRLIVTLPDRNMGYLEKLKPYCSDIVLLPCPWQDKDPSWLMSIDAYSHLIAEFNVKLVHVNTIVNRVPLVAARQMKISSVLHVRELLSWDSAIVQAMGLSTNNERIDDLHPLYLADRLISNSEYTAKCITNQYSDLNNQIHVVTNTIELSGNWIAPEISENKKIRVGLVSSNLPKKGVYDFVELARSASLSNLPLVFVLIGPENEHTIELTKDLPPNLHIAGYAETSEIALTQVDVVLNLSKFQESFGRTIAEAMLAAKPVIAYRWGALPELITNGVTGFLVHLEDLEGVLQCLSLFCRQPEMIADMGIKAQKIAQTKFNSVRFNSELAQAYLELKN